MPNQSAQSESMKIIPLVGAGKTIHITRPRPPAARRRRRASVPVPADAGVRDTSVRSCADRERRRRRGMDAARLLEALEPEEIPRVVTYFRRSVLLVAAAPLLARVLREAIEDRVRRRYREVGARLARGPKYASASAGGEHEHVIDLGHHPARDRGSRGTRCVPRRRAGARGGRMSCAARGSSSAVGSSRNRSRVERVISSWPRLTRLLSTGDAPAKGVADPVPRDVRDPSSSSTRVASA